MNSCITPHSQTNCVQGIPQFFFICASAQTEHGSNLLESPVSGLLDIFREGEWCLAQLCSPSQGSIISPFCHWLCQQQNQPHRVYEQTLWGNNNVPWLCHVSSRSRSQECLAMTRFKRMDKHNLLSAPLSPEASISLSNPVTLES